MADRVFGHQHHEMRAEALVLQREVHFEQQRVRALGAVAFVAKPVTSEVLVPVLKEYGLYA